MGRHGLFNSVTMPVGFRMAAGLGKPETFTFLGFTHICGETYKGKRFKLLRLSIPKRMEKKAAELKSWIKASLYANGIERTIEWLNMVLRGYYNYYAVPDNIGQLSKFRFGVSQILFKARCRRSQRSKWTVEKFPRHVEPRLAKPRVIQELDAGNPQVRFCAGAEQ